MSISRKIQKILYNNIDRFISRKTIIIYIQSELFHELSPFQIMLINKSINKLIEDGLIIERNNLYKLKILKVSNIIPLLVEGRFENSTDIKDNKLKYLKNIYDLKCLLHK